MKSFATGVTEMSTWREEIERCATADVEKTREQQAHNEARDSDSRKRKYLERERGQLVAKFAGEKKRNAECRPHA